VEKEVIRPCTSVFDTGEKRLFTYDGQYRLGCKGVIYILLEKFERTDAQLWTQHTRVFHEQRKSIGQQISLGEGDDFSTHYTFGKSTIRLSSLQTELQENTHRFIFPQRQLIIVGSEHDSGQLALIAAHSGFFVQRIVGKSFPIPAHKALPKTLCIQPQDLSQHLHLDTQTALVLMTHSLSTDFNYLQYILPHQLKYLGVLGPPQRKEELLNNFMEKFPEQSFDYIDQIESIYGPIGFHIGGRTPEEIAISVLAEIIAVFNGKIEKVAHRLRHPFL